MVAKVIRLVAGMDIRSVGIVANNLRRKYNVDDLDDVPGLSDSEIYEEYVKECEKR